MAIRTRKLGHSHNLTVPTKRKGIGVAQAARQVKLNKGTLANPGAGFGPYDNGDQFKSGGTIHINPANKGKFNATKKKTGKSTEELTHSSNPLTRKRAIFAQNARKWHHHADGGWIEQYADGGVTAARKRPGGSNVGKKTFANGQKRTGPYVGTSGGAPKGSYPVPDIKHARAALALAYHAPNPGGIKAAVYRKFPQLKHGYGGFIEKYNTGGRVLNPNTAGVGMGNVYPPTVQFPPEYGIGGILSALAPLANFIPGIGPLAAAGITGLAQGAGGLLEGAGNQKDQEEAQAQQKRLMEDQLQKGIKNDQNATFSWGGRIPETRTGGYGPSGLTMGNIPGVNRNRGFNYTSAHGPSVNEGSPWQRQTMSNVHHHGYAFGGPIDEEPILTGGTSVVNNYLQRPVTTSQYGYGLAKAGLLGQVSDTTNTVNNFANLSEDQMRNYRFPEKGWDITKAKTGPYGTANRYGFQHWQTDTIPTVRANRNWSDAYFKAKANSRFAFGGEIEGLGDIDRDYEEERPGTTPVELEGAPRGEQQGEVYQTPQNEMGQVTGASHEEGGEDRNLPPKTFVYPARVKIPKGVPGLEKFAGKSIAEVAAVLGREKARYEKILKG